MYYNNNLLPPIFNDWFTFISAQHTYETYSSIFYGKNSVISTSFQSWKVKAQ